MSDVETAERALRCLDLTDLTDICTDRAIDTLCAKALDPRGPVAAVCVWP
jgi:deoxyribose-phosphate aldolase